MWKVTIENLLAHRVRLLLTTLSVVLGVAFVAGTLVLTDTMTGVFDDLIRGGADRVDVMVRSAGSADTELGSVQSYFGATPVPDTVLDEVLAVDGVARAQGTVEGYALIVRPDGEPITPTGPPTLGASWWEAERIVAPGGREPQAADEVVVDAATAERNDLAVGDVLTMVFAGTPPREFTLVGLTTAVGGEQLAGATYTQFELPTAQEVLGFEEAFTSILVQAEDTVSADALVERLDAVLPADLQAISGIDFADEAMAQVETMLGFLTTVLGVFAAIALFVGAFIIANTFSVTVVQRTREFALLRAIGASRRQVVGSVLTEAVAVGLVAAAIGVVAGLGLAAGLYALMSVFGLDMPSGDLVMLPRTVLVGLTVGVVVTVLSALAPARRAASIHPLAAMRDTAPTGLPRARGRVIAGTAAAVVALVSVTYGALVQPSAAAALVVSGAVAALVALATGGPSLVRPLLGLLGGSGSRLGPTARLARGTSTRAPRRTWATAAALTIGLALVSGVSVLAGSMKASVSDALDATLRADLVLVGSDAMMGGGVPTIVAERLAAIPEVGAVSPVRYTPGEVADEPGGVTAIDPTTWQQVGTIDLDAGSLTGLTVDRTVAVDRDRADELDLAVGDTVAARFPAAGPVELQVAAVYTPDELLSGWLVSVATQRSLATETLDATVLVARAEGVDDAALRAAVEEVGAAYPAVTIQDRTEYRATVAGQVDQLLAMVTALLGMALLIAVLGIMNTLALSVHERTREIGLLRAVGMTRVQVRRMIRWEGVAVALLGVVVGVPLGTWLGWAATRVLADEGLTRFELPAGQLLAAGVLAVSAALVAAIGPARRAAKLDVLGAVTVE